MTVDSSADNSAMRKDEGLLTQNSPSQENASSNTNVSEHGADHGIVDRGSTVAPEASNANIQADAAQPILETVSDNNVVALPVAGTPATRAQLIKAGARDAGGNLVIKVYFKRDNYAIYLASDAQGNETTQIQFADDKEEIDKQIDRVIDLDCLRSKLNFLSAGLKSKRYYDQETASALRAALEAENCNTAKELLTLAIDEATEERARIGRQVYMVSAGAVAVSLAVVLLCVGSALSGGADATGKLYLSSGAGALGALLSICIALRNRTVAPDHDWTTNIVDGAGRVAIGVISAFALNLLLTSGVLLSAVAGMSSLTGTSIGDTDSTVRLAWKAALLIGFAGGFLERLVPDMLDKSKTPGSPTENAKTTGPR